MEVLQQVNQAFTFSTDLLNGMAVVCDKALQIQKRNTEDEVYLSRSLRVLRHQAWQEADSKDVDRSAYWGRVRKVLCERSPLTKSRISNITKPSWYQPKEKKLKLEPLPFEIKQAEVVPDLSTPSRQGTPNKRPINVTESDELNIPTSPKMSKRARIGESEVVSENVPMADAPSPQPQNSPSPREQPINSPSPQPQSDVIIVPPNDMVITDAQYERGSTPYSVETMTLLEENNGLKAELEEFKKKYENLDSDYSDCLIQEERLEKQIKKLEEKVYDLKLRARRPDDVPRAKYDKLVKKLNDLGCSLTSSEESSESAKSQTTWDMIR